VQDNTALRLLEEDGMLTLGSEERDIDYEAVWRKELDKDDKEDHHDCEPTTLLTITLHPGNEQLL